MKKKPTKFFYAAEKQNQNKKSITKLKNKNGELKKKMKKYLKLHKNFPLIYIKKQKSIKKNKKTL